MNKKELANRIQIFLESRGYVGNCDDGEALVEYLIDKCDLMHCPVEVYADISIRTIKGWEE